MRVYYNEIDPFAADWLEQLIAAGAIPAGVVDRRDIRDVLPSDLVGYDQCHFFAGIGGWAHALQLAGWPDGCEVWTGSCPCHWVWHRDGKYRASRSGTFPLAHGVPNRVGTLRGAGNAIVPQVAAEFIKACL